VPPVSSSLPRDLLERSSRRLGLAALIYAIVYVLAYGLGRLTQDFSQGRGGIYLSDLTAAFFVFLSLGMFLIVRRSRFECTRILELGLVYQVIGAVGIDISILSMREWPAGIEMAPLSWSVVWIVIFPLLVPSTRAKTLIAALAAASMRPLLYVIAVAGPLESLPVGIVIGLMLPNYICAGVALAGSRVIYGLGKDIDKARRMGSYRLIDLLGEGGMGEVWSAEHQMLARPAAIKLIRNDNGPSGSGSAPESHLRRFEREVQATALLRSPHTVEVYDYGLTENRTFYYVMELLSGLSLETLVKKHGAVPPERVIHVMRQACHSLAEAHERELVHRDLKPANIFLCRYGREYDFVKVLDFGLVKRAGETTGGDVEITQIGTFVGTPAYGSPEMASGSDSVDAASDIYSLGCVAFWLLTGRTVFTALSVAMMLVQHINAEPDPPSKYAPQDIPVELDAVILDCLRKDTEERPQSAEALDARLAGIQVSHDWTRERAQQWWQQHYRST
jgi:serine/threonine-protein kinase